MGRSLTIVLRAIASILTPRRRSALCCILALAGTAGFAPARADTLSHWNEIALALVRPDQCPESQLETMAQVNVAMFEAINFVRGRFRPRFAISAPGIRDASLDAVTAAAAHHVLVNSYPDEAARLDLALTSSLGSNRDADAYAAAIIAGTSIGSAVHAVSPVNGPASCRDGAKPLAWHAIVNEWSTLRPLEIDERARLHALAWTAAAHAYLAETDKPAGCAVCAAAAAFGYVLRHETAPTPQPGEASERPGYAIARSTLREYYSRVGSR